MIDLQEALIFARELCQKKGDYLLSVWEDIDSLDFHDSIDFSTKYDLSVEQEVYAAIKEKYPDHGFLGEEDEALRDENKDYVWYVDPIDGTKYFGRQVPLFTSILGLTYKGEPVLGVVYNPSSKQLYSAAKGLGAFLNEEKLHVKDEGKNLKDSIVALELGSEEKDWEHTRVLSFLSQAGRIRVFGNATLSICWALQGALGGYVDLFGMFDHGKKQDLIAPLVIAQEAGMVVKELKIGDKNKLYAVYPSLVSEVETILQ